MRRLIPTLALCSVAHAAYAQADAASSSAQIYGLVDVFAGSMQRSDEAGRTKVLNGGGMTTSFWGVRGAESLGGGLQAQFALESFFQPDSGTFGRNTTDPYFSRNAWVGLAGGFGQLALGRQTNPLFVASGAFNPFGTSLQFSPVMLHTWQPTYNRAVLGDSVWSNAVQYTSPTFAGLRANVLYGLGEVTDRDSVRNLNLTVNYAAGNFAAAVSVQQARTGPGFTTTISRQDAAFIGASYDFKVVQVYGQLQRTRTPDIRTTADTAQLGAAVPVGPGRFMASVARTQRKVEPATETNRTTWAVGYDHFLSKRTDLYAVYMRDRITGFDSSGSVGVGVRHRF
ncbi:porin [Variovorax boronicumulans]|uniref:porin n=1 Tax=Variovorax boronicumulans TaxID=436515 RepID=UPI0033912EEC